MSQASQDEVSLMYTPQDPHMQDPQGLPITLTKSLQTEVTPDVQYQNEQKQSQQALEPDVLMHLQREEFLDHNIQIAQGLQTQLPSVSHKQMSEDVQQHISQDVVSQDLRKQSLQSLLLQELDLQTQGGQDRPIHSQAGLITEIYQIELNQVPKAKNRMPPIVQIASTPKRRQSVAHNRKHLRVYVPLSSKRDPPTQPPRGLKSKPQNNKESEDKESEASKKKPKPKENALKINEAEGPESKKISKPDDKQEGTPKVKQKGTSKSKQAEATKVQPTQALKINEAQKSDDMQLAADDKRVVARKGSPLKQTPEGGSKKAVHIDESQISKGQKAGAPIGKQTGEQNAKSESPLAGQSEPVAGQSEPVAGQSEPALAVKGEPARDAMVQTDAKKKKSQKSQQKKAPAGKQTSNEFLRFSNLNRTSAPPCTCYSSVEQAHQYHRDRLQKIYRTRSTISRWTFSPEQKAILEQQPKELEFANINIRGYFKPSSLERLAKEFKKESCNEQSNNEIRIKKSKKKCCTVQ